MRKPGGSCKKVKRDEEIGAMEQKTKGRGVIEKVKYEKKIQG